VKIFTVDAFASVPFKGNPAAVCIYDDPLSDEMMQAIAAEMNLAETAFLTEKEESFSLRWFTPETEVLLCGHASLAASHVIWEQGIKRVETEIRFETKSGLLSAKYGEGGIELNFPEKLVHASKARQDLEKALGIEGGKFNELASVYLIEVPRADIVYSLDPEFTAIKESGVNSIIVTAKSDKHEYDFVSRFFAPALGIDEDPVTGSAHCYLAPYWEERLGSNELTGYQASRRGGIVRCRHEGNRVFLGGNAVTVLRGEIFI
jgi:PhzF family phenazine biosynthesis protein